jgi:hypothetical protein
MITDTFSRFAAAATALPTGAVGGFPLIWGSSIDLTASNPLDIAGGRPLWWVAQLDTSVGATGAVTTQFQLVTGTASDFTSGTIDIMAETKFYSVADLAVPSPPGDLLVVCMAVPYTTGITSGALNRYLGVRINCSGGTSLDSGAGSTFLTLDPRKHLILPDGRPTRV